MKIIDIQEHTQEWHEWRATGVNASSAPAVMSESKYFPKTPYQLYLIETGQREFFQNQAMKIGSEKESEALNLVNDKFNSSYQKILGESEVSGLRMLASFDGYDENQEIKVLEIKTTKHGSDLWDNAESIYKWQLTHQCIVAGADKARLAVYAHDTGDLRVSIFELEKSDADLLVKSWIDYADALLNFTPPPLTKKDYIEREDAEWLSLADEFKRISAEKKRIESELAALKEVILDCSKQMPSKGAGLTVFPAQRKGVIQYSKIPELENIDLDQYRGKGSTSWVIRG